MPKGRRHATDTVLVIESHCWPAGFFSPRNVTVGKGNMNKNYSLGILLRLSTALVYIAVFIFAGQIKINLVRKPVNRSSLLVKTKPDSFFFIHCPKTGTSLFTVLRNSLDQCTEKNFTCFGVQGGGGYWGRQMKNGKSIYPYNAKIMFGSNITKVETQRINTCNGKLPNCGIMYHCPYQRCGEARNKVTMIRNPYKWLPSYAHWM